MQNERLSSLHYEPAKFYLKTTLTGRLLKKKNCSKKILFAALATLWPLSDSLLTGPRKTPFNYATFCPDIERNKGPFILSGHEIDDTLLFWCLGRRRSRSYSLVGQHFARGRISERDSPIRLARQKRMSSDQWDEKKTLRDSSCLSHTWSLSSRPGFGHVDGKQKRFSRLAKNELFAFYRD